MKTRIVRVGNSQAMMIPAATMREYGWAVGDEVELSMMATGIAATSPRHTVSIAKIVRRLVKDNMDLVKKLADI